MSRETKIAFSQLYLETCRRSMEVEPDYQMCNQKRQSKRIFNEQASITGFC